MDSTEKKKLLEGGQQMKEIEVSSLNQNTAEPDGGSVAE